MNVRPIDFSYITVLVVVSCTNLLAEENHVVPTVIPQKTFPSFFQNHCVKCHGNKQAKGEVNFQSISYTIHNNATATQWQEVLDALNSGQMPPEDEPQPKAKELAKVLESLTDSLVLAKQRLTETGGEITMRRLNRREYANTIRDLFGYRILLDAIPEDEASDSFDTFGTQQYFSTYHFDQYFELAKQIVSESIRWGKAPRKNVSVSRKEAESRITNSLREKLADLDQKMEMKKQGKTWQEMGFKDKGQMEIIFQQFDSRAGKPRRYLQYPLVETGVYLTDITKRVGFPNVIDPRATYQLRVNGGIVDNPPTLRRFIEIRNNDGELGYLAIRGTTENPETVGFNYAPRLGPNAGGIQLVENRNPNIRTLDGYLKKIDRGGQWGFHLD